MEKSNLPITKKESFIYRIKQFILNLFKKQQKNESVESTSCNTKTIEKNDNFFNNIKIEKDFEKEKLLDIQNKIESGILNTESVYSLTQNLSKEEMEKLKLLYNEQISQLEKELQSYTDKIMNSKKISESN